MGTVKAICYHTGEPPALPLAVMIHFDNYCGPTLPDGTVPIGPFRHTWIKDGNVCCHLQLPLKLALAVTIHKAQGLTLLQTVINLGKKELSAGLTVVACSRVRQLCDLLFDSPFPYECAAKLAKSQHLHERQVENTRLPSMQDTYHNSTCINSDCR